MTTTSRRIALQVRKIDPPIVDSKDTIVHTRHFIVRHIIDSDQEIEVGHRLRPDELDNDLAGLLVDELFAPGWLAGSDVFERVFVGVVETAGPDPSAAWNAFYDNTLAKIRGHWKGVSGRSQTADIAPVYRRAMHRTPPGTVLDMGSCFGFFPLLLAESAAHDVIASDLVDGSMRLLSRVAGHRGVPLRTLVCDAAAVPLPDDAVETVTVLHLLEHLPPAAGIDVLREALRLATRRVVVAVPFEDEPTQAYGHLRTFDVAALNELGVAARVPFTVAEFHGGWLILDPG